VTVPAVDRDPAPAEHAGRTALAPADASTVLRSDRPLNVVRTLAPLQRGRFDPAHQVTPAGTVWRASRLPSGPAAYRLVQTDPRTVRCDAWGPGSADAVAALPSLLGEDDDASGFEPAHPLLAEAHRRHPGVRVPRTALVLESLVPAILEQRVHLRQARASWRWLLQRHGEPAPGPLGDRMRVPPTPEGWRAVPQWDWHAAGVDPGRMRTVVVSARVAVRLEECPGLAPAEAHRRLRAVPGVGPWTAAEVAQRALGDADAVSVGDLHLPSLVGWALAGRSLDDAGMLALLEQWRPHRHRVVQLLRLAPVRRPRFAPRLSYQDHRGH